MQLKCLAALLCLVLSLVLEEIQMDLTKEILLV